MAICKKGTFMEIKSNTESNENEEKFSQETVYMWMILYDFFRSNGFYETKQNHH